MNIVTATKSNNTITVLVNDNGSITPIPVTSEHPKWTDILKAWAEQNFEALLELMSMKRIVERFSNGDLVVSDSGVFYKDVPLVGIDVDRIMAFLRQNEPYAPIANYMVLKLKNPSRRAINEMYNFLEHKNMPLSPSGTILAYKGVRKDFYSVSSGKEPLVSGKRNEAGQIFNGVGEVIEMNRSDVDDDFRNHCSGGLHAGSLQYARDWAKSHDGIIIVIEINPADVVSVPEDCSCMKLRCAKYTVLGLYNGPLPDTYTAEFSETPAEDGVESEDCGECGQNPCECDDETCSDCGNYLDDCNCDKCGQCGCDPCECVEGESAQARNQRLNEAWLYEQCKKEDASVPTAGDMNALLEKTAQEAKDGTLNVPPVMPVQKETVRAQLGLDEKGDEIRQKFVAVVCEMLNVDPNQVTDDKHFMDDLGADSLDTVELVMMLEEKFNVEITDESAEACDTVGKGIAEIRRLQGLCPCSLDQSCTCAAPPVPPTPKVNPMSIMSKNLDKVIASAEQQENAEQNEQVDDTYQKGYQLGLRNGVRRRARLYRQGDENNASSKVADPFDFIRGYNDGYRAGRKDYKH